MGPIDYTNPELCKILHHVVTQVELECPLDIDFEKLATEMKLKDAATAENLYRKALIGPYDEEGTRTETVTIKRKAPGIGFFEDQPTAPEAENEGDKDGEGSVKKRKIISVKRGRYRIETEEDKGKVTETKTLIEGERLYDAETGEELEDRSAE